MKLVVALVPVLVAVTVAGATPAGAAQPADTASDMQAAINTYQATAGPGAGAYAGNATQSWWVTSGTGTTPGNVPVLPTDHFRIGSQTKTFTASVVLQLVDEGKVALDNPIEQYLPGVVDGNGYDGNNITVRELLQHTSGIPTNNQPQPQANPDGTYTLAALVKDGLSHPPAFAPGTSFEYSNTNYEILGMLIEKITGMPVGQAITTRVIQPLGLTRTSFPAPGDKTVPAPYTNGYFGGRLGSFFFWYDNTAQEPSLMSSAGAMISTEQDLTRFYQDVISGKVFSAASLAQMEKTVPVPNGGGYAYGLGIESGPLPCGGIAWGHSGEVAGYTSMTEVTTDGRYAAEFTNTMVNTAAVNALNAGLCG